MLLFRCEMRPTLWPRPFSFFKVALAAFAVVSTCVYLTVRSKAGSQQRSTLVVEPPAVAPHSNIRPFPATQPSSFSPPQKLGSVSSPVVRILVSYVYFESERQSECERSNKRTNLAMFLRFAVATSDYNVRFHFTFPGLKPSAHDILSSVGSSSTSESGQQITRILTNQYSSVEMYNASVSHAAPDLCHHYHALWRESQKGTMHFDYAVTMNDGMRGPFVDTEVAQVGQIITTRYFFTRIARLYLLCTKH